MTASDTHCRLYLIAEPTSLHAGLLAVALSGGDVACLLLSATDIDGESTAQMCQDAQSHSVAVVIDRDIDLAAGIGADGVHIDADHDAYERARAVLGNDAIIGIDCGTSRHDAMTFAELGASYVAFASGDDQVQLVTWWAELFEVPCVAWDVPDQAAATELAGLGCDFVSLTPERWSGPNDGMADTIAGWSKAVSGKRTAA